MHMGRPMQAQTTRQPKQQAGAPDPQRAGKVHSNAACAGHPQAAPTWYSGITSSAIASLRPYRRLASTTVQEPCT